MTRTAFDINRAYIPCPKCGKTNKRLIRELVVNEKITCLYCGGFIDLKERLPALLKEAEELKQIKFLGDG